MGVTLSNPNATIIGGYEVFKNCEGSAQLSLYNSLQLSIAPFLLAYRTLFPTNVKYAAVTGYMLTLVTAHDPLTLSKFKGYPDRFNLGGWRYLQANRALGIPKYIDTFQWGDVQTMKIWVAETGFPNVSFPGDEIPIPITFSTIAPLISAPGSNNGNSQVAADGFSFFLNEGIEMTFAFQWYATFLEFQVASLPLGIYLLNI